jgi:DNA repair protein RadC
MLAANRPFAPEPSMPKDSSQKRRAQLTELFGFICALPAFAKRDIQSLCQESKPAFVTRVLKQLTAEGVLQLRSDSARDLFVWQSDPNSFSIDRWIEQQISGTQVTQAPAQERPRERLLEHGADKLQTTELLAILIRSGRKGESAIQAAQKISNRLQAELHLLPRLACSELKQISSVVSSVAYCQIMAGVELGRRVESALNASGVKEKINSTQAAKEYCQRHFSRLAHDACQEEFHIVTLDTKLQPIRRHRITVGTLDASLVHPREVFRAAIRDAASAILLLHNHPSGDATPSRQDREVTDRLRRSGELLGINVIDHIIVAKDQTVSLAEC